MPKPARFKTIDGKRKPNPNWRPFVVTVTKASTEQELLKGNYQSLKQLGHASLATTVRWKI